AVATHWIGMAHKALGDADAAAKAFGEVVEKYGDEPIVLESLFHWADAELRSGDYEEAARLFEQVASRNPKGTQAADAIHFAGEAALLAGDVERASALVERFKKDYPQTAYRMHNRLLAGRIYEARSDRADVSDEERTRLEDRALAEYQAVLDETKVESTAAKARFQ